MNKLAQNPCSPGVHALVKEQTPTAVETVRKAEAETCQGKRLVGLGGETLGRLGDWKILLVQAC